MPTLADERCPDCGALLALVGSRHLCRPRAPAASPTRRPRGRPPLALKGLSPASAKERQAKRRAKKDEMTQRLARLARRPRRGRTPGPEAQE